MNLSCEANNFFQKRKGFFENITKFKSSIVGQFYTHIFGELVFTEQKDIHFIGIDKNGFFYDEIYYPLDNYIKKGSLVPKVLLDRCFEIRRPSTLWKDVANNGFCVIENMNIDKGLGKKTIDEAFIPFGVTENIGCSSSFSQAYFFSQGNYDIPEQHRSPDYLNEITKKTLTKIPQIPSLFVNYKMSTADLVKYVYDEKDLKRLDPPNIFHMDYFKRCCFMYFIYFSKEEPIIGRELSVGRRKEFNFSSKNDFSLFDEKVYDESDVVFEDIKIKNNMVILMNTLNPSFVHRVRKLREDNEVTLVTNYFWSEGVN